MRSLVDRERRVLDAVRAWHYLSESGAPVAACEYADYLIAQEAASIALDLAMCPRAQRIVDEALDVAESAAGKRKRRAQ